MIMGEVFMYEKCIKCERIGLSCVPNLMLLPFPDLIRWCNARQKHLGWTNHVLEDKSGVPIGTINRIKAGDYIDCKYSTIKAILVALIGGTTDEFPCNAQVEQQLAQVEALEKQAEKIAAVERENEVLKEHLSKADELHRADIRAIRAEYVEQLTFLKDEITYLRALLQKGQ